MPSKKKSDSTKERNSTKKDTSKISPTFEIREGSHSKSKKIYAFLNDEDFARLIGEITMYDFKSPAFWMINKWEFPYDFMDKYKSPKFPDEQTAASFLYYTVLASNKLRSEVPVSKELINFISNEARSLFDHQRTLKSLCFEASSRKRTLAWIIEKLNINVNFWELEDENIKQILEFKLSGQDTPFFSEASLYPLIGKEDARSVLALLRRLTSAIDPTA